MWHLPTLVTVGGDCQSVLLRFVSLHPVVCDVEAALLVQQKVMNFT